MVFAKILVALAVLYCLIVGFRIFELYNPQNELKEGQGYRPLWNQEIFLEENLKVDVLVGHGESGKYLQATTGGIVWSSSPMKDRILATINVTLPNDIDWDNKLGKKVPKLFLHWVVSKKQVSLMKSNRAVPHNGLDMVMQTIQLIEMKDSKEEEEEEEGKTFLLAQSNRSQEEQEMTRFKLKKRVLLRLVRDFTIYPNKAIPLDILPSLEIYPGNKYAPLFNQINLGAISRNYVPIKKFVHEYEVEVDFQIISLGWWRFVNELDLGLNSVKALMVGAEEEIEDIREMFATTDPLVLLLTLVVTLLHSIFEALAIKDDIEFWQQREQGVKGISARSLLFSLLSQIVITLYLSQNKASYMILLPSGFSILLTIWKIIKVYRIQIKMISWLPPIPTIDFGHFDQNDSNDMALDAMATHYLGLFFSPLIICYSGYSLLYSEHHGWYDWLLSTLASAIYVFGFVLMTPQLFINYQKKKVPKLPWMAFFYRALNTIIDDLFAMIIYMPTMHRLSCFRDDVIFAIYLYQRWIYPVDEKTVENPPNLEGHAAENKTKQE